ncbi:hypothetical protein CLAIMM_00563 [Cladophialophora immunda]|nr:hypothetical protein CLAIMM_00563 [Cladophialophora immunda]
MDAPKQPAAKCDSIPQDGGEQQHGLEKLDGEDREPIMILDHSMRWRPMQASVDCSLPRHRIDLQTLRQVHGQHVKFSPDEHSHPGLAGSCIGTFNLRVESHASADGFREVFCIVKDEDRGVVLTRSLKVKADQASIFPIGNWGGVSTKEQKRLQKEARERAKKREKEKSKEKDEAQREKDKEIRGEPSTQQSTS